MYDCQSPLTPKQKDLADRHYFLAIWVVKSKFKGVSNNDCREFLRDAAIDGLLKATQRYRSDWISPRTQQPVQFQTYATKLIWQACYNALMEYRKNQARNREVPLNDLNCIDPNWKRSQVELDDSVNLLTQRINKLPQREKNILYAKVVNGESVNSIAKQNGLSREGVRQLARRAERRLRTFYNRNSSNLHTAVM